MALEAMRLFEFKVISALSGGRNKVVGLSRGQAAAVRSRVRSFQKQRNFFAEPLQLLYRFHITSSLAVQRSKPQPRSNC